MKRVSKIVATSVVLLFMAATAWGVPAPAPLAQPQVLFPGLLIPKFVDPLPVAGQISVVNATSLALPGVQAYVPADPVTPTPAYAAYNIHIREFQAQILPSTGVPGIGPATIPPTPTPSWVWGYLTEDDIPAGGAPIPIRPSYLGPVVVAQRGVPAYPTYTNELPDTENGGSSYVQQLLPIDMTLDWANPLPIDCTPDQAGALPAQCLLLPGDPLFTPPFAQPTATHFHGGEVEPAYDGGPDAWETPGGGHQGDGFPGNTYTYPNGQQEGTPWFHDHALGLTRLNVYAGLAGIYPIVDPANPPQTTMPKFPEYDIPLIIQDRSFDTTGQIMYNLASNPQPNPTVHPFWIPEFIGDTIVVNGKTWPYLNVEPRQYRFRLLNGSNARFYDLTMSKGLKFLVVATDGGYLPTAVPSANVIIAPGERYEVIVDFSKVKPGSKIVMMNAARTPFPAGAAPTKGGTDTVMQFVVNQTKSTIPDTAVVANSPIRNANTPLEPIINGFTAGSNITRQLTLNEVIGAGGPLELVVNNSKFNKFLDTGIWGQRRWTEAPAIGDTEIWEIINITADAHPMHTHLITFQILDRTPFQANQWIKGYDAAALANGVLPGQGPPNSYIMKNADGAYGGNPPINAFLDLKNRLGPLPYEMGWKDTAIMYPGQVTRIVARWAPQDAPAPALGQLPGSPVPAGGKAYCEPGDVPITDPTICIPSEGYNLYPFDPMALIGGVGYVWHCHIIDHEDNEMMRNYTVTPIRQFVP